MNFHNLVVMNTTMTRSTKKTPYDIVFGQKVNSFHNVSISASSVNIGDINDTVEKSSVVGREANIEFSVSTGKKALENEDKENSKRRKPVNFNVHHPNQIVDEDALDVTCPKRKIVRDIVKLNLEKGREKMERKYNSTAKITAADFSVGDNISVKIPKRDRHATNVIRIPWVIIQKGSGKQPTYKLLSEFGVLSKRYTVSKVMSFPVKVKCDEDTSVKICLRAAAKKVIKSNNTFCNSKGMCTTMSCRCCKEHVLCSSRCHGISSENCKNKNCYKKNLSHKSKLPTQAIKTTC